MRAKDFIPASKPRNPVVRQQQTSGAGAHRDKKKEQKQGYEKHKGKEVAEGVSKQFEIIYYKSNGDRMRTVISGTSKSSVAKQFKKQHNLEIEQVKELKQGVAEGDAPDYEMRRRGKTPEDLGGADAWYHRGMIPNYYGFEKGTPEFAAYIKGFKDWDEGPSGGKQWEATEMEGRHGYDDAGFSLAPGHDEGEPVYNPRYDRTGQYDRKAKYSQDYNYKTGKPLGAPSEKKGFVFYNVKDADKAREVGLKQTKSGKWYAFTTDRFLNKSAEREFGAGKVWYPKD